MLDVDCLVFDIECLTVSVLVFDVRCVGFVGKSVCVLRLCAFVCLFVCVCRVCVFAWWFCCFIISDDKLGLFLFKKTIIEI